VRTTGSDLEQQLRGSAHRRECKEISSLGAAKKRKDMSKEWETKVGTTKMSGGGEIEAEMRAAKKRVADQFLRTPMRLVGGQEKKAATGDEESR